MAMPMLTDQTPSVTMKEGTRSRVTRRPLARPKMAPTTAPNAMPIIPRSSPVRLFKTDMAKISELTAMTPSTERSIEP